MTSAPDALADLMSALDGLAHALESGDAGLVLTAEEHLATAVTRLRSANPAALVAGPSVRARIQDVRRAVDRCRALGRTASDLAAIMAPPGYGPTGLRLPVMTHATSVASRT